MRDIQPNEIGVILWAGREPAAVIGDMKAVGATVGQLGVPGDVVLTDELATAYVSEASVQGVTLVSIACAYNGESYADMETVQRTVGYIPPATREERERRTMECIDFAQKLGVSSVSAHVGFIPHEESHPDHVAMRELVRRIADYARSKDLIFSLETGQETAESLLHFLQGVDRANVKINFDPANMILYGTGDPIDALMKLAPQVYSVHCKDGDYPHESGQLGVERPLGQGGVGIVRYLVKLREIGYRGPLVIERECESHEERIADLKMGAELLRSLNG